MPITLDGTNGISTPAGGTVNGVNAYSLRKVTILNTVVTNATYTTPANCRMLKVTVIGGGGGGGGCAGTGTGASGAAGSGGGAVSTIKYIYNPAASYTYTVGAGGAGGAAGANTGSPGGTSSFVGTGVNLVAAGGFGGSGRTANGSSPGVGGTPAYFASAATAGGDINIDGGAATSGLSNPSAILISSLAGTSMLGGAIRGPQSSQAGSDARTYGSGGAGAGVEAVAASYAGGNGAQGVIIIEEYF